MEEKSLSLPKSKEEFLAHVEKLSYDERVQYASRLGRDNKASAELKKLIEQLRTHPEPTRPEIEADDDFTELLPSQERNVAKFLHEDQLALAMAAASKANLDVIKDEVESPSILLKSFAVKEFVRSHSDETIQEAIFKAVPSTRRKLLHACIGKKESLLDKILPKALETFGIDIAADFLHGCSSAVVKKRLEEKEFFESPSVNWKLVARYHKQIVLEIMRNELKESNPLDTATVWTRWETFGGKRRVLPELVHSSAEDLLQLWKEFPELNYIGSVPESEIDKTKIPVDSPDVVPVLQLRSANFIVHHLKYLVKQYPDRVTDIFLNLIHEKNTVIHAFPSSCWGTLNQLPYEKFKSLVDKVLSLTTPAIFYRYSSGNYRPQNFLGNTDHLLSDRFSFDQVSDMYKLLVGHLKRFKSTESAWTSLGNGYFAKMCSWANQRVIKQKEKMLKRVDESLGKGNQEELNLKPFEDLLKNSWEVFKTLHEPEWNEGVNKQTHYVIIGSLDSCRFPGVLASIFAEIEQKFFPDFKNSKYLEELVASYKTKALNVAESCVKEEFYPQSSKDEAEKLYSELMEDKLGRLLSKFNSSNQYEVDSLFRGKKTLKEREEFFERLRPIITNIPIATLTSTYFPKLSFETVQSVVKTVDPETLSKSEKESLTRFQDIRDPKVRSTLQKATDSNSVPDRNEAIDVLIECSIFSHSREELLKTLKFLQKRMKNESAEQRSTSLKALLRSRNSKPIRETSKRKISMELFDESFLMEGVGSEEFDVWFALLSDALESRDLDENSGSSDFINHPILGQFFQLSQAAIVRGALKHNEELLTFGIELQWRIILFRQGERKAAQNFRIYLSEWNALEDLFESEEGSWLVNSIVGAYQRHVQDKHPDWAKDFDYFSNLFQLAKRQWTRVEGLVKVFKDLMEEAKSAPKDNDGLYILEKDHPLMTAYSTIKAHYDTQWMEEPLLVECAELLLHSRQVPSVFFSWWNTQAQSKTRKEKKVIRDKCIMRLLEITPSAIHLKVVWGHLLRYRQPQLSRFINSCESFRGVFYVDPDQRPLNKKASPHAQKMTNVRRSGRGGSRPSRGRPSRGRGGRLRTRIGTRKQSSTLLQNEVQEENEQEKEMKESIEGDDHRDFFCLEACYGLHRLLPTQINALAQQWQRQIFNSNRSTLERAQAAIRWTLMPTVVYSDVVAFLNKHSKELSVNLIEAILKGVMRTDEPVAPLHFLFSPQFLASDRARIAVYVAARCVPYLKEGGMTATLDSMLTGKRRNLLKITTYKEVIRLLMRQPSEAHLKIVEREWARKDLHRDVRIAILQTSFVLMKNEKLGDAGWRILEQAVTSSTNEVLVAILGSTNGSLNLRSYFTKPRLKEYIDSLTKFEIPKRYREKYARGVALKLAEVAQEDDVRHLALAVLKSWLRNGIAMEAAKLFHAFLLDTENKLFLSENNQDRIVYQTRWENAASSLVRACGMKTLISFEPAPKSYVVEIIEELCQRYQKLNAPEDRKQRIRVYQQIKFMMDQFPAIGPKKLYSLQDEEAVMAPIQKMEGFMWEFKMNRKALLMESETVTKPEGFAFVDQLLRSGDEGVDRQIIENIIQSLIAKVKTYSSSFFSFLDRLLDGNFGESDNVSPFYQQICHSIAFGCLDNKTYLEERLEKVKKYLSSLLESDSMLFPFEGNQVAAKVNDFIGKQISRFSTTSSSTGLLVYEETAKEYFSFGVDRGLAAVQKSKPLTIADQKDRRLFLLLVKGRHAEIAHFYPKQKDEILHHYVLLTLERDNEQEKSIFDSFIAADPQLLEKILTLDIIPKGSKPSEEIVECYFNAGLALLSQVPQVHSRFPSTFIQFLNWCISRGDRTTLGFSSRTRGFAYSSSEWGIPRSYGATSDPQKVVNVLSNVLCSSSFWALENHKGELQPENMSALVKFLEDLSSDKFYEQTHPFQEMTPKKKYHKVCAEIVLSAIRHIAPSFKIKEEGTFRTRPEFVKIVDRLSADNDSLISEEAANMEI